MSTADIIIGPARVLYSPVGEAIPDETTVAYGAAWGGNWEEIALTKTPFTMNRDVSTFDAMVEQSTLPVKRAITEEKVAFETTLAELTAVNLQLAMGGTVTTTPAGAGQVAFEQIVAGGKATLDERQWGVEGVYVDASNVSFPIRIIIYRATAVLNGELSFGKGDSTGIPLRIDSLGDLTKAVGAQLLIFQKVTAAATS